MSDENQNPTPPPDLSTGAPKAKPPLKIKMRKASEITPKCILWEWAGRIPIGKLTLFGGETGLGKSFVLIDIIARITTGRPMPDEPEDTVHEPGSVILLAAEDDPEDTIVPRLIAAGANLEKVHILEGVILSDLDGKTDKERLIDLSTDMEAIRIAVEQTPDCRMVVLDPLSSYCGKTKINHDTEVRNLLMPLAVLAAKRRFAVVYLMHINKAEALKAISRVTGSGALVNLARASWMFAQDPDEKSERLFLPLKNNCTKDRGGLSYQLVEAPTNKDVAVVVWGKERVDMTADEALAKPDENKKPLLPIAEWLENYLQTPQVCKEVKAAAVSVGYKLRTLERTANKLKVIRGEPVGFGQKWKCSGVCQVFLQEVCHECHIGYAVWRNWTKPHKSLGFNSHATVVPWHSW